MLHGVDISAWRSGIPDDQDFVVCKATEGTDYNDSHFSGWWKALGARGTLRGAYHFGHPKNDATKEADHFLSMTADRLSDGDVLVLDFEAHDDTSPSHCATWARTWLYHVEQRTGVRPVVYTFISFANDERCAGLGDYPLWIADPSARAGHPRLPSRGPWSSWVMHQYSEAGGIDHDVFNGSTADWRRLGKGNDVDLTDKVTVNGWILKAWPKDRGLADGSIQVNTALGSTYGHARAAHDGVVELQTLVTAQNAVISELASALKASQPDLDELMQRIEATLSKVTVHLAVDDGEESEE